MRPFVVWPAGSWLYAGTGGGTAAGRLGVLAVRQPGIFAEYDRQYFTGMADRPGRGGSELLQRRRTGRLAGMVARKSPGSVGWRSLVCGAVDWLVSGTGASERIDWNGKADGLDVHQ